MTTTGLECPACSAQPGYGLLRRTGVNTTPVDRGAKLDVSGGHETKAGPTGQPKSSPDVQRV
jgi:hypothetical protein